MANVLDVAAAIVESEPGRLTHLALQKLVYFAQGWHLAWTDEPLFKDTIEAWPKGPAVGRVYMDYKRFESDPIPEPVSGDATNLTEQERQIVAGVVRAYERFSPGELLGMTHDDDPWKRAREGYGDEQRSKRALSRHDIQQFFRQVATLPGPREPLRRELGERIAAGDGHALAQAFETGGARVVTIRRG